MAEGRRGVPVLDLSSVGSTRGGPALKGPCSSAVEMSRLPWLTASRSLPSVQTQEDVTGGGDGTGCGGGEGRGEQDGGQRRRSGWAGSLACRRGETGTVRVSRETPARAELSPAPSSDSQVFFLT